MKLGFYYHIPARKEGRRLLTAGYLGCFLDALAEHVDELMLFMHEEYEPNHELDYCLKSENIHFVSLGRKPHAIFRTFVGGSIIKNIYKELQKCDMLLLRAPTHLFKAWINLCHKTRTMFVPLIVGDYKTANKNLSFYFLKKLFVQGLNSLIDARERACLRGRPVIVNSHVLAEKFRTITTDIHEVRTTTLTNTSFFIRNDTCTNGSINFLYTGRFEWQKGLKELVEAFCTLVNKKGIKATLHFAGWQDSRGPSIEDAIKAKMKEQGLGEMVVFHGKKKVGPELNKIYRRADIFIMPSYAEGFPRTIWEAMANSLPVIATKVGSIPYYIDDGYHAVLVEPGSSKQLQEAILKLKNSSELRKKIIINGRALARTNTLEKQAQKLANLLNKIGSIKSD